MGATLWPTRPIQGPTWPKLWPIWPTLWPTETTLGPTETKLGTTTLGPTKLGAPRPTTLEPTKLGTATTVGVVKENVGWGSKKIEAQKTFGAKRVFVACPIQINISRSEV